VEQVVAAVEVLHRLQQTLLVRTAEQVEVVEQLVLSVIMRPHLLRLQLDQEELVVVVEVEAENSQLLALAAAMVLLVLMEAMDK
jgi:hypothetical protein